MSSDHDPQDPLYGIDFTIDELKELIDLNSQDPEVTLAGSMALSWAIDVLPVVAEASGILEDEEAALELETYTSSVAASELLRLSSLETQTEVDTERKQEIVKKLRPRTKTPLKDSGYGFRLRFSV